MHFYRNTAKVEPAALTPGRMGFMLWFIIVLQIGCGIDDAQIVM